MPSNASRAGKIPHDKELYKARSELECTFSLLEQARRFATRYEKTLRNDAGRTHPRGLPTPSRTPLAVR
jgi:transposase